MHQIFILSVSCIALLWSAHHLVMGARGLALRFQISSFAIGLTLVALATTLPGVMLSFISALRNTNDLTIGNAVGSNIANISLVLGIIILIKPAALGSSMLKQSCPILIIAMLFVYSLILDGDMGRVDGCLFLIACIIVIATFIYKAKYTAAHDLLLYKFKSAIVSSHTLKSNVTSLILGVLVLPLSTKSIVSNTADLALWLGMNQVTIGLTIQAIGTTLPELVTAVIAALNDEEELAIGTILGSNVYNLLLILAFPALINPMKIDSIILSRDMPIMISLALVLLFLNMNYKKSLSSWHGGLLILVYCSYIISLVLNLSGLFRGC